MRSPFTSVAREMLATPSTPLTVGRGGHRVVQQMWAQLVPRFVHVVGDEDGRRSAVRGKLNETRLMAVRATFVLVQLLQATLVGLQDDAESVPGRALHCGFATAGHHDERPTRRCARGRDSDAPALDGHRVAFQQLPQQSQFLVGQAAPQSHVDAEVVVLLLAVADAERV